MAGGSLSHFLANSSSSPPQRAFESRHRTVRPPARRCQGSLSRALSKFSFGKKIRRMSVGRKLLVPIPRPFSTSPVDLRLISPPVARPPSQTDSGVLPLLTYKMWDMSTCVERRGRGCDGREQTLRLLMMGVWGVGEEAGRGSRGGWGVCGGG